MENKPIPRVKLPEVVNTNRHNQLPEGGFLHSVVADHLQAIFSLDFTRQELHIARSTCGLDFIYDPFFATHIHDLIV